MPHRQHCEVLAACISCCGKLKKPAEFLFSERAGHLHYSRSAPQAAQELPHKTIEWRGEREREFVAPSFAFLSVGTALPEVRGSVELLKHFLVVLKVHGSYLLTL